MTAREISIGNVPVPRRPSHVRRRAGLGALLPGRVRRRPVGHPLGRPAPSTACWRAATARSTPSGSRRATACGAPTSRPRTTPDEAGLGFAVKPDKGVEFLGRDALLRARERCARAAAGVPGARRSAGGVPGAGAGPGGRRGRRPGHERRLRLRGRQVDRLRLRAGGARRGRDRGRGRGVRRVGRRRRWRPSRCGTPRASGSARSGSGRGLRARARRSSGRGAGRCRRSRPARRPAASTKLEVGLGGRRQAARRW